VKAIRIWWIFLICVIVIAGFPRFEARQAHYAERTSGVLSNQIGALLLASGATELNHIRLGQRNIGYQFIYRDCEKPMKVIAFSIAHLASRFARSYAEENHRQTFQYLNFFHQGSARVELTAIWVLNSVKSLLTLSPYRASSEQIVVLWPENCDTPNIDWSAAWHHSNIEI